MDLDLSESHDILSTAGFLNSIFQVLNLRPGSGAWSAPVCSSWTWMCPAQLKFAFGSVSVYIVYIMYTATVSKLIVWLQSS